MSSLTNKRILDIVNINSHKRKKTTINCLLPNMKYLLTTNFSKFTPQLFSNFKICNNIIYNNKLTKLFVFRDKNNICLKIKSFDDELNIIHMIILIDVTKELNINFIENDKIINFNSLYNQQTEQISNLCYTLNLPLCNSYSLYYKNEYQNENDNDNEIQILDNELELIFYDINQRELSYKLIIDNKFKSKLYKKENNINIINYNNKTITEFTI